jgi:hypothetical protein
LYQALGRKWHGSHRCSGTSNHKDLQQATDSHPAKVYKEMGFSDYAFVEQIREGLLIRPLNVDNEDISIYVLRKLVDAGYEGDELIERYKDACPAVLDFRERLRSSEQQIGEGGTVSFAEMQKKMREKHGL